MRLKKIFFQK